MARHLNPFCLLQRRARVCMTMAVVSVVFSLGCAKKEDSKDLVKTQKMKPSNEDAKTFESFRDQMEARDGVNPTYELVRQVGLALCNCPLRASQVAQLLGQPDSKRNKEAGQFWYYGGGGGEYWSYDFGDSQSMIVTIDKTGFLEAVALNEEVVCNLTIKNLRRVFAKDHPLD